MKTINKLQFAICVVLVGFFASCHITNTEEPVINPTNEEGQTTEVFEASGILTIPTSGFTKENIRTKIVLAGPDSMDIYMYEVKFAAAMPVTIDMIISGVHYAKEGNQINFHGDGIIPTAGNKPYKDHIITNLVGTITTDSIFMSNNYGSTPSVYAGKLVSTDKK
ncbi:MAG: hypothetical protein K6A36_07175 [Paludibacteraceae bacterium]|nr:hypothetical protein [Paludibacteraceae bacterium]